MTHQIEALTVTYGNANGGERVKVVSRGANNSKTSTENCGFSFHVYRPQLMIMFTIFPQEDKNTKCPCRLSGLRFDNGKMARAAKTKGLPPSAAVQQQHVRAHCALHGQTSLITQPMRARHWRGQQRLSAVRADTQRQSEFAPVCPVGTAHACSGHDTAGTRQWPVRGSKYRQRSTRLALRKNLRVACECTRHLCSCSVLCKNRCQHTSTQVKACASCTQYVQRRCTRKLHLCLSRDKKRQPSSQAIRVRPKPQNQRASNDCISRRIGSRNARHASKS
jgi:hypothetical protein